MKRVLLTLVLSVLACVCMQAQDRTVSGKVADESGEALPGVTVIVKGTTTGTATDIDGKYQLAIPENATLTFNYLGYVTQDIVVGSQSVINVTMVEEVSDVGEVVVTALGISREKRSLGYAVQEISGEDLVTVKDNNIVNSLSGKIAGVQVTGSPGSLGGSSRILIRGVNSISGNNQPLFVVDGTPIDNSEHNRGADGGGGADYGNAAADINADDIESVSVLKGASAAALYGSRAANGVILITTKSGSKRKGIGMTFTTGVTANMVAIIPDYQNEYGGGYTQEFDLFNDQPVVNYAADESWGPRMDGQLVRQWYSWYPDDPDYGQLTPFLPHPDNVKDFYETGITTNNNVAFSGGNEFSRFRISYTNYHSTGTIPNSELAKNTVSVKGSSKLSNKLTASTSFSYVNLKNDGVPSNGYSARQGNVVTSFNQWFQRQLDINKLKNYQTADGIDRTWNISSPTNLDPLYWENPYWVLYKSPNNLNRERVFGNISLAYEIMEGLNVQAWARTDFYTDRREERISSGSIPQDFYEESVRQFRENNYEFLVRYNKQFGGEISLDANFGANSRQYKYKYNRAATVGGLNVPDFFNVNASIDRPAISDETREKEVNSIYGSASIGYKGTYFVDVSLRNDWSSALPTNDNSYLYPSVTGSVVFSELFDSNGLISFGKVRGGWSQVGNDTDPYRLGLTYSPQSNYGSLPAYAVPNTINNPNLKPERITTTEIGLEMKFLNDRVGFDVTYYDIVSRDQILPLDIASTSGSTATIVNAGKMTNKGVEVQLSGSPIRKANGLNWDVSVNWAKNENEVVELAEGQTNYLIESWGPSINARIGSPYGSWTTDGFVYHENGQRIVNPDGTFARATNQDFGTYLPEWTGGVTNNFSYKGFNVSVHIDFQNGGTLYSVSNRYGTYSGLLEETIGLNDRGNPKRDPVADGGGVRADGVFEDGTPNDVYIDAQAYYKHLRLRREYYLYDASFVKLREVNISYSLPNRLFQNLPFNGIDVSLIGRNLAILHKNVPNVDPESAYGAGNTQGFENGQHPSTRSVGVQLRFKF